MKKLLVSATCLVLLLAGAAQADTLTLGSHYTSIAFVENGTNVSLGGGSFDIAKWNGAPLDFIYCVDLGHTISLNGTYGSASETRNGIVNGNLIGNAGQVAWLLDHYGTGGNGYQAYALQAAIWHVIYDTDTPGHEYGIRDLSGAGDDAAVALYYAMLNDLDSQSDKIGNIAGYRWITPSGRNNVQGQVASVPEAGALLLFGSGLVGLVGYRRARRMQ